MSALQRSTGYVVHVEHKWGRDLVVGDVLADSINDQPGPGFLVLAFTLRNGVRYALNQWAEGVPVADHKLLPVYVLGPSDDERRARQCWPEVPCPVTEPHDWHTHICGCGLPEYCPGVEPT